MNKKERALPALFTLLGIVGKTMLRAQSGLMVQSYMRVRRELASYWRPIWMNCTKQSVKLRESKIAF